MKKIKVALGRMSLPITVLATGMAVVSFFINESAADLLFALSFFLVAIVDRDFSLSRQAWFYIAIPTVHVLSLPLGTAFMTMSGGVMAGATVLLSVLTVARVLQVRRQHRFTACSAG